MKNRIAALMTFLTACLLAQGAYSAQAPVSADEITSRAKQFVESLMGEDYSNASKHFDENLKKVLPAEKLREVRQSLITNAGLFKRQVSTRTEKQHDLDFVFVTCEFAVAPIEANTTLSK